MATADDIKAKIARLRELVLDEESAQTINKTERALRTLIVQKELKQNDAALAVIADIETKIENIDYLLLNDEGLSLEERKILFRERRLHKFYRTRLSGDAAEATLNSLAEAIQSKIDILTRD